MIHSSGIKQNTGMEKIPTLESLLQDDFPDPESLKTRLYERVHRMRKQRWAILRFFVNKSLRKAKYRAENGVQWSLDNTSQITMEKVVHILECYHKTLKKYTHRPGNTKTMLAITRDFLKRQKQLAIKREGTKNKYRDRSKKSGTINKNKLLASRQRGKPKHSRANTVTENFEKTPIMLPDKGKYEGDSRNGQPYGIGVLTRANGTKLSGTFINGKLNGFGTLTFPDGRKISGAMENDLPQGVCEITFKNGKSATTRFINGYHKCTAYLPFVLSGGIYHGDLRMGIPEGEGCFEWFNGITYKGEVKNGKANGWGVMTWPDGYTLATEFKDGKFTGSRQVQQDNRHMGTYHAEFTDGIANGPGTFEWIYPEKQKITTVFTNNSFFGVYEEKDKFTYKGQFLNGLIHGKGLKTWKNHDCHYSGDFSKGLMHGIGRFVIPGMMEYEGQMDSDRIHGEGKTCFRNGKIHEGQYVDGKLQGKGTMRWKSGWVYVGQFGDNKIDGQGRLNGPVGELHEGVWEEGFLYRKPANDDFVCPITYTFIREPVCLDGRFYEKSALVKSIQTWKRHPWENTPLTTDKIKQIEKLPIDFEKRKQIIAWLNDKKNRIHIDDIVS